MSQRTNTISKFSLVINQIGLQTIFSLMQIPIEIHKVALSESNGQAKLDESGKQVYYCGFSIGGGIDQNHKLSPQNYPDNVI